MKSRPDLLLQEDILPAGKERIVVSSGWELIWLAAGPAYWLASREIRALSEGELLVLSPGACGSIQASQISEARLEGFRFDPQQLLGLLTLQERAFFRFQEDHKPGTAWVLPPDHEAARTLRAVRERRSDGERLVQRLQLLEVVALALQDRLAEGQPSSNVPHPARERLRQLLARLPEIELIRHSLEELAGLCGCTARHFTRLFREEFGLAPRAHRAEVRLRIASRLLTETQSKVVDVALESGYRNLSLFNELFKRRFHMTPSEWRRKQTRRTRLVARLLVPILLLIIGHGHLRAASSTNATPAAATAPVTFDVKGYQLLGNTLLPPAVTDPILRKHIGPGSNFETIRQALADLQLAYRERGFVTVGVSLPPQQLTNGLVRIQVMEGRLAEITVQGNRHFSSNNVMRALPSLQTNTILNSLVFQQELDRANRNSDRQIYPVINPGAEPGTSALDLKVKDRLPLHGRVELDNYSTPQTPELRANSSIEYNDLWQLEHQVGLQYSFSPEDYKQGSFPFYDRPLVSSYSAFYRMPLAAVNGTPRERPYELSEFGYDEVTHRFHAPPLPDSSSLIFYASRSSVDTGALLQGETLTPPVVPPEGTLQVRDQVFSRSLLVNENLGARWSLPLPDLGRIHSALSLGPDFKNFRSASAQDRTFQATVFVPEIGQTGPPFVEFPSPPTVSSRSLAQSLQYLPVSLTWEGAENDRFGATSFSVSQSVNDGGLLTSAGDFRSVAGSTRANGDYYIVQAALEREQRLPGEFGLRLHADGQWANQPLISNEQYALGGMAGVRGYRDGQEYGDTGWRVQFEPHTPTATVGVINGKLTVTSRLFTFVDYGERYLLDPGTREGRVQMLGLGGGMDTSLGTHVAFRIQVGVPALDVPGRSSGDARASFTFSAQY